MGQTGCVGYMFEPKGLIVIEDEDGEIDEDTLMETALEAGAEDLSAEDGIFEITCETDDVYAIKEALEAAGYKVSSAEQTKLPTTYVTLESEEDIKHMALLLEHLEDNDDVIDVYHNWENEQEI
jgi:transcriptional/translational regulatory protein YebC/TACO1